jgi:serine/threonine protein kinase
LFVLVLILETINDIYDDNELLEKTLKITDFGLARKQLQSSSMSTAGTFAWMSPECIRNNEFSTKSDVWR